MSDPEPSSDSGGDITAAGEECWRECVIHRARMLGEEARDTHDRLHQTQVTLEKTWQDLLKTRAGIFDQRQMREAALNLLEDAELARRREEGETTARERAEAAGRESEARFRTLFESMDEGVITLEIIFDEQGNAIDYLHVDANPAFTRQSTFGSDIIGKRISEIYPELPAGWLEHLGRVARTGEPGRFEERGAGDTWFDVHASRVGGPASCRVVCLCNSITERKHREENLALLAEVDSRFPSSSQWRDLLLPVCRSIRRHFRFTVLKLIEFPATTGTVTLIYDSQNESTEEGAALACRLDEYFSPEQVSRLKEGEVIAIDDTRIGGLADGGAAFLEHGPCSILSAPCLVDGGLRFLIAGIRKGIVPWRHDETELLRELAARIHLRVARSRSDAALQEAHDLLEARVGERTRDLAETLTQLRTEVAIRERIEDERMELLKRQMRGQEDERLRISRDLHDTLGQNMVTMMLSLDALRQQETPAVFNQRLQELRTVMDSFNQAVRRQAWELRPAELEHLGLEAALQFYVYDWSERTGIDAVFTCERGEPPKLSSEAMIAVYRITQESLTNIHRHAKASSVSVRLEFNPRMTLRVEDDGAGFAMNQVKGRLGLVGMKERMMIVKGTLEIDSAPGLGTRVVATLAENS